MKIDPIDFYYYKWTERDLEARLEEMASKINELVEAYNELPQLDNYALKQIDEKLLKLLRKDEDNTKRRETNESK